jgi:putative membrane protein
MMGYGFSPLGGFGMGFGFIFMILFWVIIIWAISASVKWFSHQQHQCQRETKNKTPIEILQERYAKGEINKQEFEEKKKDLT